MTTLTGRIALVTGAGRGLGAAVSRLLASEGATVICADVRRNLAEATADAIERDQGRAFPLHLDITDWTAVSAAMADLAATHRRLDILINNAAIDITLPVEQLGIEDWNRIVATNLSGPFFLTKASISLLRRSERGHIVNIASTASKRAWPNASAYHASKWGLLGLSHALLAELRPAGIKVTAIVSGGMRTPFLLDRFPDINRDSLQDPANVAATILFALTQPHETVIPEIMVLPMMETSWP